MSERTTRVFTCDAPGSPPCKSFCDLGHAVPDEKVPRELESRGWRHVPGKPKDVHLCPFHRDVPVQVDKSDKTDEESDGQGKSGSD